MTEPKPPTDALDEQERELARILRALPGGDPPAALDQRILRAAANAAAASRRPRAAWLASSGALWGIGTAAAAVLALGVSWQMLDPTRPDSDSHPQAAPAAFESDDNAVTVELGEMKDSRTDAAAMPPPAEASQIPAPRVAARQRTVSEPAAVVPAPASPPPAPLAFAEDQAADAGLARDQAAVAAAPEPALNAIEVQSAESATLRSSEQVVHLQQGRAEADARAGSAAKARSAESAPGAMTPALWLARVRKLRGEGRLDEARNSLNLFQRYYPQYVVPADLAPLLRE